MRNRFSSSASRICKYLALSFLGILPLHAQLELDTDDNGLSDIWEIEHFGSIGQDRFANPDGDNRNNQEESVDHTDPEDKSSSLQLLNPRNIATDKAISFTSVVGKKYHLEVSENGSSWTRLEAASGTDLDLRGSGGTLSVDFTDSANLQLRGAVTRQVWLQTPAEGTADLKTFFDGAGAPSGTEWRSSLKGPSNYGDDFSSRYTGYIIPKESGDYTFYVAGRGVSELHLNTSGSLALAAEVDTEALAVTITEEAWETDSSQKSQTFTLTAGTPYLFELLHVARFGNDHIAVGWETPSSSTIEVIPGTEVSPIETFSSSNSAGFFGADNNELYVKVQTYGAGDPEALDSDSDGIDDATENLLSPLGYSPFAAASPGHGAGNDADALAALLNFDPLVDKEEVSSVVLDGNSVELESPPLLPGNIVDIGSLGSQSGESPDKIRFRIRRNKSLNPVTVFYTLGGGTLTEEVGATSGTDYTALEQGGASADGILTIPAFTLGVDLELTVLRDNIHEYPETISLTIDDHTDYDIAAGSAVSKAEITDMPASVNFLFVGAYTEDFNASPGSSKANGTVSGYLKGDKRTFIVRNDNFSNLSSPQNDTHFHKVLLSGGNPVGGPPIHDILSLDGSTALLGHYLTYDWDLTEQNPVVPTLGGAPSRQVIIDSLFNQNSETQIYINLHTDGNAAGETMAMLELASGSSSEPAPPPEPEELDLLSGEPLESEIVRFLNQATFGAAWEEVESIKSSIETKRSGNPNYSRLEEFELWIDNQCEAQQTFLADYVLAADNMEWNLRGFFDPAEWNDWTDTSAGVDSAPFPTEWPYIDRSLTNGPAAGMPNTHPHIWANQWYPVNPYALDRDWINRRDDQNSAQGSKPKRNLGEPVQNNRRRGHWALMVNGKDQLRQKFGYSIQQLLVVSETLGPLRQRALSAANYQDMLNYYGLPSDRNGNNQIDDNEEVYFRDLIGYVNWSPVMGNWLTSIFNRAAYDTDGDGEVDVYPDENLAREDMQLFTIGLFNLWTDGSLRLESGADPNVPPGSSATYTNTDIQEFARILTGQGFSRYINDSRSDTQLINNEGFREGRYQWGIDAADNGNVFDTDNSNNDSDDNDGDDGILYNTNFTRGNGDAYYSHTWNYPMRMFGSTGSGNNKIIYHDLGVKTIAGGRVIDNTNLLSNQGSPEDSTDASMIALGVADIEDSLDWFAGKLDGNAGPDFSGDAGNANASHASTPPFICRRLIQRMTTSNPSSAYLYRVAKAFKDSEGCMRDVCKAILLDPEIRDPSLVNDTFGMKKPPLEAYMQLLRTFEAHSLLPMTADNSKAPFNGSWPTAVDGYNPGNFTGQDQYHKMHMTDYAYPTDQANNFRFNCQYFYNLTDNNLSMSPFAQETVFNYYLPDFSKGVVQSAALVAPELQLATETEVVRNANYFWTLTWQWDTGRDNRNDGQSVNQLGGSSRNMREVFSGTTSGGDWDSNNRVRIDFQRWADQIYSEAPFSANNIADSGGRTGESLEDEAMVDFIDRRLMAGQFKINYPFDTSDDEDPTKDGFSPRNPAHGDGNLNNDLDSRNPREWIIHTLTNSWGDGSDSETNRMNKFRTALYLMSISPEYQIKK